MSKEKTSKAGNSTKSNEQAGNKPAKLKTGWEFPHKLLIIGLDVMPDQEGYDPELEDPDRIKDPPDAGFVKSLNEHGPDGPVRVQETKIGDKTALLVVNGRQTVMAGRIINESTTAEHALMIPWYVKPGEKANALDVTRANEFAKVDSPIQKARRAARLKAQGYSDAEIISSFSDDGAKPITKMTLHNWKSLLKCPPDIQERIESKEIPVATGYQIGAVKDKDPAKREAKQREILAIIESQGGSFRGEKGRQNVQSAIASVSNDPPAAPPQPEPEAQPGDASSEDAPTAATGAETTPPQRGTKERTRIRGTKMSAENLRKATEIFTEDDDSDDCHPKTKLPFKEYENGDFQRLAGAIFALVNGDDPTGERIKEFPSVARHLKFAIRSAKAE